MFRATWIVLATVLVIVAESSAQFILPTYRPPRTTPRIYRVRRDADEPLWINKGDDVIRAPATGDHPYLPPNIDDIKLDPNRRYARSAADEPMWINKGDDVIRAPATGDHPFLPPHIDDVKIDPDRRYARSVDSPSAKRGGGSHSTHSGSRNTGATHPGYNRRNARSVHNPRIPTFPKPSPFNPRPPAGKPLLIAKRDIQFPQKPKYHDIVLTGFNPNAQVKPWQKIRVKANY